MEKLETPGGKPPQLDWFKFLAAAYYLLAIIEILSHFITTYGPKPFLIMLRLWLLV